MDPMHGSMGDKMVNAHYVALQLELATLYSNIFSLLCGRFPVKFLSFDSRIATQHLFYIWLLKKFEREEFTTKHETFQPVVKHVLWVLWKALKTSPEYSISIGLLNIWLKKKVKQKQPKLTNVVQKYNTVDRVLNITSRLLAHVIGVTLYVVLYISISTYTSLLEVKICSWIASGAIHLMGSFLCFLTLYSSWYISRIKPKSPILSFLPCPTRMFLAARSLWTRPFSER